MKKTVLGLGAIIFSLLLVSTATAVPHSFSNPAMNIIHAIAHEKQSIENLGNNEYFTLGQNGGIIEIIIQLLTLILQFIIKLIEMISDLIRLVGLIQDLIDALLTLFDLIQQLIQLIMNIFNPKLITNL